ncbi:RNA-splicing factor [Rhodotorula mucilaginosa]|uniref:Pre-mRNA-splicing factor CWC24 n=1 Tax=Rhodotorula mucilaginosa TaxID=5537 RepID=A0A9P6W7L6_RHOMI|nr:RNA-splicing factor [Rhodotorula mucilaginosa]TKA54616.1 hypothetical protein B0A53_03023 [Rhodotorula sp. CCFEE 5036]
MSSEGPVTFIKKRKGAPAGLRKKGTLGGDSAAEPATPSTSEVVHATKRSVASHLIQGTGNKRRRTQQDAAGLSDSDDDSSADKKESFAVRHSTEGRAQRRRSESPPAWMSSEQVKELKRDKNAAPEEEVAEDGLYHGSSKQRNQVPKAAGPVKAGPTNVRQITLVDYQPDVCKDYKETGFCGFGDTCKFLHDRGDYLHGWQLDNSFLSNQAASGSFMAKQKARDDGGADSDSDSDTEDLPFACLICRKPFGPDPIVTLCGHYFDSACAIKRFAKTGKCFACGASTNGVFNRASKLIARQKEREALNAKAREEEEGEAAEEGDGIEIEGLADAGEQPEPRSSRRQRSPSESEGEYEEEEEEVVPRRRPIIEIQ